MFLNLLILLQLFTFFNESYGEHTSRIISFYNQHKMDEDLNLQKSILEFTDNGFLRFKKYDRKNKLEYYSVNLQKVVNINFLGHENSGFLKFTTNDDLVIIQTFNDPKGNVDSMSNTLEIPVKNLTAEDLNTVLKDFSAIEQDLSKQKK